jgi:N-acetyl-gamma-glutamyl-phosphate reductase
MIAGILGATGYAGVETVRILLAHGKVDGFALASASFEGKRLDAVYGEFASLLPEKDALLRNNSDVIAAAEVVFSCLPAGKSEEWAAVAAKRGVPFIDFSADFRFGDDEETYRAWYGLPYTHKELHTRSVYGLPELNRAEIAAAGQGSGAAIIANPGCYPTAATLAALPALRSGLYAGGTIIVDAASGVTGAGREPARMYHFPEMSDSMTAYKTGCHRHSPEIARNFVCCAQNSCSRGSRGSRGSRLEFGGSVIFTPHLAPMNRGILATVYIPLSKKWAAGGGDSLRPASDAVSQKAAEIHSLYADFYRTEHFVRVLPPGTSPATNRVRASNFCDISVSLDQTGTTLIVLSAIDNMVKGAAGQAIQNMNILCGFPEGEGLEHAPALF